MTGLTSTLVIGEEIGRGHFGRVHSGSDGVRNQVAVKVLRQMPDESSEKWAARRVGLLNEGANLERATHRNVVAVYYVCEAKSGEAIHLVMEYCPGGSLDRAYQDGPMSPDTVLKISREVCLGLSSLHTRGMLHRDIKPGNILTDARGVAKLGDFGFVTDDIVDGYAAGGGYRDHLAPEFYSDRVSSVRTDLWALGMTIYRLLHGHAWYSASPAPRSVVAEGGFADRLKWLPHIGKDWRRFIRSLLNDNPAGRPSNANAALRALSQIDQCDWMTSVTVDGVVWRRSSRGRNIEVELTKTSPRKCSWSAVSYPQGSGRRKTLGGDVGVTPNEADQALRLFFS